jgi:hypothetical protein
LQQFSDWRCFFSRRRGGAKLRHVSEIASSGLAVIAQWGLPLMLALAIWLTLAPVAVWLAVTED